MMQFDPNHVLEEGYQISYSSPTGELYQLHSRDRQANRYRRVALAKGGFSGGFAAPQFTEKETTNRYGARRAGVKLPPFEGTLSLIVRADERSLAFNRRDFTRAWSPFDPGTLYVVARDGNNASTPVVLNTIEEPPHETAGKRSMPLQVGYRALEGCWFGKARTYTGAATVIDSSDRGLSPVLTLAWTTAEDLDVTFPSGHRVSFKRSSYGGRLPDTVFFDLEPGMMGRPTDAAGNELDTLWSAFAGKMRGFELTPHIPTRWALSGCELRVTPRYLHPWR
ncbi:hypothetical protein [Corynebacterium wankanglinii]|uniref:Uncharacterized protein n=1 Tax=Corynebacterium wankanglinii TaxID=2735136 RepID=A0A838CHW1_9CORY|nr:hypothetical protein [Corynebacterium wankanglinii]MBA1834169.1 hypothetical protein [Corynebacterium wankanglinii]